MSIKKKISLPIIAIVFLISSCGENAHPVCHDTIRFDSIIKKEILSNDSASTYKTTFDVADVKLPPDLIPTHSAQKAIEERIGKKLIAFPDEQQNEHFVPVDMNGFVQAVQYCYAEHRPLIISPDEIWLLLCQGFSIHMNEHFDSLKTIVFKNDKPKDIRFRNDNLVKGNSKEWKKLIDSLSFITRNYAKQDVFNSVVQKFSTTSSVEQTAFEITLLESQKKAFNYMAESGCGIPQITLKGFPSDWKRIDSCVNNFRKFGLDNWIDNLHPLLQEFISASEGKENKKFWNGFYKESFFYSEHYISGWITKFFPYIKAYDYDFNTMTETFHYIPNEFLNGNDYCLSNLTTRNFPGGFAKINVTWNVYDANKNDPEIHPIEIYAGFLGLRQDSITKALEPVISWAVCEEHAKKVSRNYDYRKPVHMMHTQDWMGDIKRHYDVNAAIYGDNKTVKAGKAELISFLTDTLNKLSKIENIAIHQIKINFFVTWSGEIAGIKINSDDALAKKTTEILLHLPKEWQPEKMLGYNDVTGKQEFYKVNSKFYLELF